eukprot:s113_g13.t1
MQRYRRGHRAHRAHRGHLPTPLGEEDGVERDCPQEAAAPHMRLLQLEEKDFLYINMHRHQAGHILGDSGFRPVLINFANECDAGGGWLSGMWGAQEECLMRRSSLYLSLWPLRRPDDELWRRSPPNRGPFERWVPDRLTDNWVLGKVVSQTPQRASAKQLQCYKREEESCDAMV